MPSKQIRVFLQIHEPQQRLDLIVSCVSKQDTGSIILQWLGDLAHLTGESIGYPDILVQFAFIIFLPTSFDMTFGPMTDMNVMLWMEVVRWTSVP